MSALRNGVLGTSRRVVCPLQDALLTRVCYSNHGFLEQVQDRGSWKGTNITDRICLGHVVELHVVDQNIPASINYGLPPHGLRHNKKRYMRYRFVDVVDRGGQLSIATTAAGVSFLRYMQGYGADPCRSATRHRRPCWSAVAGELGR